MRIYIIFKLGILHMKSLVLLYISVILAFSGGCLSAEPRGIALLVVGISSALGQQRSGGLYSKKDRGKGGGRLEYSLRSYSAACCAEPTTGR